MIDRVRQPVVPELGGRPPDIVVVTHFFPSHGGGVELVAARLVEEYLRAGCAVDWFSSATDAPPVEHEGLRAHPVSASNMIERATQLPYPLWTPAALPRLWRAIGSSRAVHVHDHFYIGSIAAIVIARLRGKCIVLTQHVGERRFRARVAQSVFSVCTRLLALAIMRFASTVAFVSANVMHFFEDWLPATGNRRLVFNGVEPAVFRTRGVEERRRWRAGHGLDPDVPVVIFAGRFVSSKGLGLIRQMAQSAQGVNWILAGAGPEDPSAWALDNVHVLGRLEQTQLSEAYAASDILVLPSISEGFPLVVQEALACGLAILSTREVADACPDAAGMIRAEELALDGSDLARWSNRMHEMLSADTSEQDRTRRSRAALTFWSWTLTADTYLRLLGIGLRST